MFNFIKKLAGGGKEESCGKGACGSTAAMEGSSCSIDKSSAKAEMKTGSCGSGVKSYGGCGHSAHNDDDHTSPKGSCH